MTLQYPRNDAWFVGCHCEASEATKHTEVVGVAALKAEKFLKGESPHVLLSSPFSSLPPISSMSLGFEERWIVHTGVDTSGIAYGEAGTCNRNLIACRGFGIECSASSNASNLLVWWNCSCSADIGRGSDVSGFRVSV